MEQQQQGDKTESRAERHNKVLLAVIPAVAGIVVAVIGVVAVADRNSNSDAPVTPTLSATAPAPAPTATVDGQSSTSAPSPTSPASATSEPGEDEPIRHKGSIKLMEEGERVSLNAPASDPTWGEGTGLDYWNSVSMIDGKFYFSGGMMTTLDSGTASYDSCSGTTGYRYVDDSLGVSIDVHRLTSKKCLKWDADDGTRYASVVFKKDIKGGALLDVTVWYAE